MVPGNHTPPNDVASIFYPQLGPYSSRDPTVIDRHMKWISSAGIDVLAVSWYPSGMADEQGTIFDVGINDWIKVFRLFVGLVDASFIECFR
jgi:hypothetical protein